MVKLPFGKKKKKEGPYPEPYRTSPRTIPTYEVSALSSRGVPEPEIINTLRNEGYTPGEIDMAMKEALRTRVSSEGPPPPPMPMQPVRRQVIPESPSPIEHPTRRYAGPLEPLPMETQDFGIPTGADFEEEERPEMEEPELPEETLPVHRRHKGGVERKDIEELTEVLVDEKLSSVKERFKAFQTQIDQMNNKMNILSGEIDRIRTAKTDELKGIEDKIDNYRQIITDLNGRIASLERALKDSLSPMLQSVRSLSDMIKAMKEEKG